MLVGTAVPQWAVALQERLALRTICVKTKAVLSSQEVVEVEVVDSLRRLFELLGGRGSPQHVGHGAVGRGRQGGGDSRI